MKKGSESESSKSYNPSDAPSRVESVSNKFSRLGVINKKQPLEAFSLSVSAYAPPPPHTHTHTHKYRTHPRLTGTTTQQRQL
jgi:hypothetical protein